MIENGRILGPHLLPLAPPSMGEDGGPFYYLSWPGWELYLKRRLGFGPGPGRPRPLLLPDARDPETDYKAIDQLSARAAQMGADFWRLADNSPESFFSLVSHIRGYQAPGKKPDPLLDDRSYLALWSISEHLGMEAGALLARARQKEKEMWAALRGDSPDEPADAPQTAGEEPDQRAIYALSAWRRLAGTLLDPGRRHL